MEVLLSRDDIALSWVNARFQRGVDCLATTPTTVQEFLTGQLHLPADYVRDRIATLFLDGMVVDDPQVAILHDGSTMGLSAAMPGLVGATLRKGGYYAPMRSQLNWTAENTGEIRAEAPPGTVRLKLYNLILREQSFTVLAQGIVLAGEELIDLLRVARRPVPEVPPGEPVLVRVVDARDVPRAEATSCA